LSALEVTRIVGSPGKGGGCGGHEDGHDTDHETGHDPGASGSDHEEGACGTERHGLIAACTAIDPAAETILLKGPFASRRYQLRGPDEIMIWVSVGETTGAQMASWQSSVPVDAVIARTGKQLEIYQSRPAALEGTGVVGPISGSGPRPMADIAFCVVVPPAVDVVPARSSPNPPPTVIYDIVVPPFDATRLDPPPVVLSAELEADSVADETEVTPPAPVTPELTSLPFTGSRTLGLLAGMGVAMLALGGLLIAGITVLDHRPTGARERRRGEQSQS
jgi:hypothetical protein